MAEGDDETTFIGDHESGVRWMLAKASGDAYMAFGSLAEAREHEDAVVILEGDNGGQIYLVCPVKMIACEPAALQRLLEDLDEIAWPGDKQAGMYFEPHRVGDGIAGGMGGARVIDGIWIHREFEDKQLRQLIEAVLRGDRLQIAS